MHPLMMEDLVRERTRALLAEAARQRVKAAAGARQVGGLRRSTGRLVIALGAHIAGAAVSIGRPGSPQASDAAVGARR